MEKLKLSISIVAVVIINYVSYFLGGYLQDLMNHHIGQADLFVLGYVLFAIVSGLLSIYAFTSIKKSNGLSLALVSASFIYWASVYSQMGCERCAVA